MELYVCLLKVLKVARTGLYGECKDGESEDEVCISLKQPLVNPSTANEV